MIIELGLLLWFGAKYMKKRLDEQDFGNNERLPGTANTGQILSRPNSR